jgi:hypothetical protein
VTPGASYRRLLLALAAILALLVIIVGLAFTGVFVHVVYTLPPAHATPTP